MALLNTETWTDLRKILRIEPDIRYTLEDITKIYTHKTKSGTGSYYALEVVLSYYDNGVKRRKWLNEDYGVNIQFAQNLHIGAELDTESEYIPKGWEFFDLPNTICEIEQFVKQDIHYLNKDFLFNFSKKNGGEWKEDIHSTRIAIFEFEEPVTLNGVEVNYVTIPSFEIARYFLFDSNLYNHYLIESEFGSKDRKNCIYNPEASGIIDATDGSEIKYVQLRKEIDDSCSQRAGDLAFQPKFRRQAVKLTDRLRSTNIRTFSHLELPLENFDEFRGLGIFTRNSKGKQGVSIKVITHVSGYSDHYAFGRDNDGRKAKGGNSNLTPTAGGEGFPSPPANDLEDNNVDNNELGDISIEQDEFDFQSEFDQFARVDSTKKVEKVEQEYKSKGHGFLPEQEILGVGGLSGEGGSGSGYQGADNTPDDPRFIKPYMYWLNFFKLVNRIKEEWSEMEIKYLQLKDGRVGFYQGKCKQRLSFRSKSHFSIDYYLLELKLGDKYCYLIEFNQGQTTNGVSLSVFHSDHQDISHEISRVLKKLSNKRGNSSSLKKETLFYSVETVKHRTQGRGSKKEKTKAPKLFVDDAIESFISRVISHLRVFFS